MINAGKIFSGLLVYLTSPKPRVEGAVTPVQSQETEDKRFQPTVRSSSAARKQLNPLVSEHELQGLGPILKHKRGKSNLENGVGEAVVVTKNNSRKNSTSDDPSAVGKNLPTESATAIGPLKGGEASNKHKQGRKHFRNELTRNKATSAIGAYPTQRPPRRKPARKTITVTESLRRQELRPEKRDPNQVPAARPPTPKGSDHDDFEGYTPEQRLINEESLQKNHASPESPSERHKEVKAHTPEKGLDPEQKVTEREWIANVIGSFPNGVVDDKDLMNTADKPVALFLPTQPIQESGSSVNGLLWAYTINTKIDEILDDTGIYLWRKPKTHFCAHTLLRTENSRCSVLAPVIVSHEKTGNDEPIIEFDGATVHVVSHEQCWEDVRSHESHPDFLAPWKLAEYQACEAAGYQIWRHDRDLLECRKAGCGATVSDYHHHAVVCLGCGPKSVVRYCSLQHQLEDIEWHWKECGTWKLLLKCVIDHTTAPSKFDRMYPAIRQRHGSKTAALYRQMLYCALTYGHYTLFDPASNRYETLNWPKQDREWPEMDRRVERLLNVAFLDSWNHCILGYLYRLLRELLRCRGEWFESTERILKLQFESEFSNYKVNTNWHNGDPPCQCEWSGKILPRCDHLSTCREYAPVADDAGPTRSQKCVEATVEEYEEKFWILRAWRQQHPTQNNWRLRAAGYGFPNTIPDEGLCKLGPGWTGWGGEKDNICKDQGDQGEKCSMRSA